MISNKEKILHWFIFLSFLGLITTALAADFFFSKEAIMESMKSSLPMLNLDDVIAPADRLFIARIERRDTWDWHFYFGIVFGLSILFWIIISIFQKKISFLKSSFYSLALILLISGIWLYLRLYINVSTETFALLKEVHHYGYYGFIGLFFIHLIKVIHKENYLKAGTISSMFRFTSIILSTFLIFSNTNNLYAQENFNKWVTDQDYLNGIMYLNGEKGFSTIKKSILNCPYDKCKINDTNKDDMQNITTISIKEPDYKKALSLLNKSSKEGNLLAAEEITKFLKKRIDYKAQIPNEYLLNELKKDTNLDYDSYKKMIIENALFSSSTNKGCNGSFFLGEVYEFGYLGFDKDFSKSKEFYSKAADSCPQNSLFKTIAKNKTRN